MSETFDPYHRWLGIPPEDQPPTHYRLLGLNLWESDPEVIRDAVEQRIAHVRTYQMGKHVALSQKILNELAAAKVCLLLPDKRAQYDRALKASLAAKTALSSEQVVAREAETPTMDRRRPRVRKYSWQVPVVAGVALLAGVLAWIVFLLYGGSETKTAGTSSTTSENARPQGDSSSSSGPQEAIVATGATKPSEPDRRPPQVAPAPAEPIASNSANQSPPASPQVGTAPVSETRSPADSAKSEAKAVPETPKTAETPTPSNAATSQGPPQPAVHDDTPPPTQPEQPEGARQDEEKNKPKAKPAPGKDVHTAAMLGHYQVAQVQKKLKQQKTSYWEFRADNSVWASKSQLATWKAEESKIRVTFSDAAAGEAILRSKRHDCWFGTHTRANGEIWPCELQKLSVVAVCEYHWGKDSNTRRLWSNGRQYTPDNPNTWERKGTKIIFRYTSGFVDTCTLSPDGTSFDGRNQRGTHIWGRLAPEP